jgi:hypothetical protein
MRWLVGLLVCSSAVGAQTEDMPHMRMTTRTAPAPGDSAKAAAVVVAARSALVQYADYHRALADGFKIFLPRVPQPVYHFSNRRYGIEAIFHFDPSKPTSLLYERTGDSTYRLVGAMYTAPRWFSLAQLNERVPLSVAQWHEHTNWCLPPRGARNRILERGSDGRPLFGPNGSIATESACQAAGGRFFPQLLGWMVHVHPMAGDPGAVWGAEDMKDMHMAGMSGTHGSE